MKTKFTGKYGRIVISSLVVLIIVILGVSIFHWYNKSNPTTDEITSKVIDDEANQNQSTKNSNTENTESNTEKEEKTTKEEKRTKEEKNTVKPTEENESNQLEEKLTTDSSSKNKNKKNSTKKIMPSVDSKVKKEETVALKDNESQSNSNPTDSNAKLEKKETNLEDNKLPLAPASVPSNSNQKSNNKNTEDKGDIQMHEDSSSSSESNSNSSSSNSEMTKAEKYYRENGTLLRIIDASESTSVPNEAEVVKLLEKKGFTDVKVTYSYEMGGKYRGEIEITGDASVKRPMYEFLYRTNMGYLWNILIINGEIFAYPMSYNQISTRPAELIISETKEVTSYDDIVNKYYINIPKESVAIIKVIDVINAETLEKLTNEEIDKL